MDGVTGLFLNPHAVWTAAGALLALAREQGVQRVVVMSALNADFELAGSPPAFAASTTRRPRPPPWHPAWSGVSVRSGFYAVNTMGMWADQIRAGDIVRGAYASSAWAPLHERDPAAVGAHALAHR